MIDDNTPINEVLFDMQVTLCDRFQALTPLILRRERAIDVFRLVAKYNKYAKKKNKSKSNGGQRIIRRPASDTWF